METWISVSDRKPANEQQVLCLFPDRNAKMRVCKRVEAFSISTENQPFEGDAEYSEADDLNYWPAGWYCYEDGMELWMDTNSNPTHWMELPEDPPAAQPTPSTQRSKTMSEDENLLMLAAKAEGREPPIDANGVFGSWVGSAESGHWWNPLEDDGDALRLATSLRVDVLQDADSISVKRYVGPNVDHQYLAYECIDGNRLQTTRRAIVRAAAEIGKATA